MQMVEASAGIMGIDVLLWFAFVNLLTVLYSEKYFRIANDMLVS